MLFPCCYIIAIAIPFFGGTNETTQSPIANIAKENPSTISTEEHAFKKSKTLLEFLTQQEPSPQGSLSPYEAIAKIPNNIFEYEYASQSLFGGHDILTARGIEPSITYTSDIAGNPVGGIHPKGGTYMDNIAFNCLFNTEKLFGWHGGYLMVSAIQRDGISLSQKNIGNQFPVQQVQMPGTGTGETFHFYELDYEQRFYHDHASIKSGRFIAGDDFDSSPLYWLYMGKGINGRPLSLGANGNFTVPPNASWASRFKIELPSSTSARIGAYQMTQNSVNGLNWNFYPHDGVMLLAQYEWDPEFFKPTETSLPSSSINKPTESSLPREHAFNKARLPASPDTSKGLMGHYWMGGYYSTYEYTQFNSKALRPDAFGFYWHADQTVYRPHPTNNTGLVLWTVTTLCPQENISLLPLQINGGAIYTGLIPTRRNDFTIAGFTYGEFSSNYANIQQKTGKGNPTYELVYEFGYRVNMTKFAYIQPDLQWIINPGGTGHIPNAVVLGAQIGVVF